MTNLETDRRFMQRCINLAKTSLDFGDAPFGSLIAKGGELISESVNDSNRRISEHAEVIVLDKAHHKLGTADLSGLTLYTSCEPCPMCSFMIREYKISRVVFALHSPFMGGYSKWKILQDAGLQQFPPFFREVPEIISGFMEEESAEVMRNTPFWMFGKNPVKPVNG